MFLINFFIHYRKHCQQGDSYGEHHQQKSCTFNANIYRYI